MAESMVSILQVKEALFESMHLHGLELRAAEAQAARRKICNFHMFPQLLQVVSFCVYLAGCIGTGIGRSKAEKLFDFIILIYLVINLFRILNLLKYIIKKEAEYAS